MEVSSPNLMLNMGTGASGENATGKGKGKGKGKGGTLPGTTLPQPNLRGPVKMEPTDLETWSAIECARFVGSACSQ